ncbi:olfactory receptor class A-like protein 1 [Rhinatrema bivittatum]|uniref:olfactory receptor class A-like protein 1 n=1 Tax=Rhinatrema bivittatum TaxID=194408 RepID=UPI00112C7B15|nr:olfactory receptor class A-like protein 1 [Rhinatrema bivittatum]
MELEALLVGLVFSLVTILGFLGNSLIIALLSVCAFQEMKLAPAERILLMLAMANLLFVLTLGLPLTTSAFKYRYLLTDKACRADLFLARVSRAMTICLTSLLTCYQGITLASASWKWRYVKSHIQTHLNPLVFLLLLVSLTSSINAALFPIAGKNFTDLYHTFNLGYCLAVYPDQLSFQLVGFITFFRDLVFVILMAFASAYILWLLNRHEKQVKDLKKSTNMESQAAKTVLTLTVVYVMIIGIDNIMWFYQITMSKQVALISDTRHFLSTCYPAVFPMVVLVFNRKLRQKLS